MTSTITLFIRTYKINFKYYFRFKALDYIKFILVIFVKSY